jgi:Flp pilus assembly protein TadG
MCGFRRRIPDRARRASGQSMVELAILLPLLTLILIGTLDFARVFFDYIRLSGAVREGAIYGARNPAAGTASQAPDPENIAFKVKSAGGLALTDADITITCYQGMSTTPKGTGDCAAKNADGLLVVQSGDSLVVTASTTFRPFTGRMLGLFPSGITLRKSMRVVIL